MPGVKQEVIKILDNLPDDCTFEDVQYHLFVLQKIDRGLNDAKEGRVYNQEEMEKRMEKWLRK